MAAFLDLCPEMNITLPLLHADSKVDRAYERLPGSSVSYKCSDGYQLQGTSTVYCLLPGSWSDSQPRCIKGVVCMGWRGGGGGGMSALSAQGTTAGFNMTQL